MFLHGWGGYYFLDGLKGDVVAGQLGLFIFVFCGLFDFIVGHSRDCKSVRIVRQGTKKTGGPKAPGMGQSAMFGSYSTIRNDLE